MRKAVDTDYRPRPRTVYRDNRVEETTRSQPPGVKLRRTVIDEVIVDQSPKSEDALLLTSSMSTVARTSRP